MAQQAARQIESVAQREDRMLHTSFLKNTEVQALSYGMYAMRSDSTPANVWYLTGANSCTCAWQQHNTSPCSHMMRARLEDEFRAGPTGPAVDIMVAERTLPPAA